MTILKAFLFLIFVLCTNFATQVEGSTKIQEDHFMSSFDTPFFMNYDPSIHLTRSEAFRLARSSDRIKHDAFHGVQLTMKTLLLGMLVSASLGPIILMDIEPNAALARDFGWSMVGGTFGTLFFLCFSEKSLLATKGLVEMSRCAMGNLLLAVLFGPSLSYFISSQTELMMTPHLIIPTSAVLAIGGVSVIRIVGPKLLTMIGEALPTALMDGLRYFLRVPPSADKNP